MGEAKIFSLNEDPLLSFHLATLPPLLSFEGSPVGAVEAFLFFDEEKGLSILWKSNLDPVDRFAEKELLYKSRVSDFVSKMDYAYFDEDKESWELEENPEQNNGEWVVPHALKLELKSGDTKRLFGFICRELDRFFRRCYPK